jgi:phosphoesterase RecJ-like protein
MEDTHGVVNQYFMSIKDTDFAFLLEEYQDGKIFGMVRSRTDVDSSALAKAFGGGGHRVSSGFRFLNGGDLLEIEKQVHEKIREIRDQIK